MSLESTQPVESCKPRKRRVAHLLARRPLTSIAMHRDARRPVLRILNFHSVPRRLAPAFASLVDYLCDRFDPVLPGELDELLATGPGNRSRVVFTFDDGLANHAAVAAPILEDRGLRGIFCIPSAFPSVPEAEQAAWFQTHVYPVPTELHPVEERRALTWEQARALAGVGHRICSHGEEHVILVASTPASVLQQEIVDSRAELEGQLGVAVDGFAWAGAEDPSAREADRLIRATYAYSLGNNAHRIRGPVPPYNVARINLEASWPREVIELQLSGAIDALFALRRARGQARTLEPRA